MHSIYQSNFGRLGHVNQCATANPDGRKRALVVGGGIANFTDVAATFNGIIRALREKVRCLLNRFQIVEGRHVFCVFLYVYKPFQKLKYILDCSVSAISSQGSKGQHLCPERRPKLPKRPCKHAVSWRGNRGPY